MILRVAAIATILRVFAVVILIGLLAINFAYPRDLDGRYANSPHKAWIESLKNGKGTPCCDEGDGSRVEDPDWRNVGNEYEVRIDGKWTKLEDYQVLTDTNRIGFAMVWIWRGSITCFMPGERG